jgi:hypothetical protein
MDLSLWIITIIVNICWIILNVISTTIFTYDRKTVVSNTLFILQIWHDVFIIETWYKLGIIVQNTECAYSNWFVSSSCYVTIVNNTGVIWTTLLLYSCFVKLYKQRKCNRLELVLCYTLIFSTILLSIWSNNNSIWSMTVAIVIQTISTIITIVLGVYTTVTIAWPLHRLSWFFNACLAMSLSKIAFILQIIYYLNNHRVIDEKYVLVDMIHRFSVCIVFFCIRKAGSVTSNLACNDAPLAGLLTKSSMGQGSVCLSLEEEEEKLNDQTIHHIKIVTPSYINEQSINIYDSNEGRYDNNNRNIILRDFCSLYIQNAHDHRRDVENYLTYKFRNGKLLPILYTRLFSASTSTYNNNHNNHNNHEVQRLELERYQKRNTFPSPRLYTSWTNPNLYKCMCLTHTLDSVLSIAEILMFLEETTFRHQSIPKLYFDPYVKVATTQKGQKTQTSPSVNVDDTLEQYNLLHTYITEFAKKFNADYKDTSLNPFNLMRTDVVKSILYQTWCFIEYRYSQIYVKYRLNNMQSITTISIFEILQLCRWRLFSIKHIQMHSGNSSTVDSANISQTISQTGIDFAPQSSTGSRDATDFAQSIESFVESCVRILTHYDIDTIEWLLQECIEKHINVLYNILPCDNSITNTKIYNDDHEYKFYMSIMMNIPKFVDVNHEIKLQHNGYLQTVHAVQTDWMHICSYKTITDAFAYIQNMSYSDIQYTTNVVHTEYENTLFFYYMILYTEYSDYISISNLCNTIKTNCSVNNIILLKIMTIIMFALKYNTSIHAMNAFINTEIYKRALLWKQVSEFSRLAHINGNTQSNLILKHINTYCDANHAIEIYDVIKECLQICLHGKFNLVDIIVQNVKDEHIDIWMEILHHIIEPNMGLYHIENTNISITELFSFSLPIEMIQFNILLFIAFLYELESGLSMSQTIHIYKDSWKQGVLQYCDIYSEKLKSLLSICSETYLDSKPSVGPVRIWKYFSSHLIVYYSIIQNIPYVKQNTLKPDLLFRFIQESQEKDKESIYEYRLDKDEEIHDIFETLFYKTRASIIPERVTIG